MRGRFKVGPALNLDTQMGPLVSEEQLDRVCGYLESGFSQGAKAASPAGKRPEIGIFRRAYRAREYATKT